MDSKGYEQDDNWSMRIEQKEVGVGHGHRLGFVVLGIRGLHGPKKR